MHSERKFGKKISLPSTAQIGHELKMACLLDTIKTTLDTMEEGEQRQELKALKAFLDTPFMKDTPSPARGMEMLRRGLSEQKLIRLLNLYNDPDGLNRLHLANEMRS